MILSAEKSKKKFNIPAFILAVFIVLYLLFVDIPNPDYGLIRSEAFYHFIDTIENLFSADSTVGTALIPALQWII